MTPWAGWLQVFVYDADKNDPDAGLHIWFSDMWVPHGTWYQVWGTLKNKNSWMVSREEDWVWMGWNFVPNPGIKKKSLSKIQRAYSWTHGTYSNGRPPSLWRN